MYPKTGTYQKQLMRAAIIRIANPFIYGRVLGIQDVACPRSAYERAIEEAIANRSRLAWSAIGASAKVHWWSEPIKR